MAKPARPADATIWDARLIFKNFTGKGDIYNKEGDRNVTVDLPREVAEALLADGFNVRTKEPREEGGEPQYLLKLAVSWKLYAPQLYMIPQGSNRRTLLSQELVGLLDDSYILKADIVIEGSPWESAAGSGIKAYLKEGYFTIQQSALGEAYAEVPIA